MSGSRWRSGVCWFVLFCSVAVWVGASSGVSAQDPTRYPTPTGVPSLTPTDTPGSPDPLPDVSRTPTRTPSPVPSATPTLTPTVTVQASATPSGTVTPYPTVVITWSEHLTSGREVRPRVGGGDFSSGFSPSAGPVAVPRPPWPSPYPTPDPAATASPAPIPTSTPWFSPPAFVDPGWRLGSIVSISGVWVDGPCTGTAVVRNGYVVELDLRAALSDTMTGTVPGGTVTPSPTPVGAGSYVWDQCSSAGHQSGNAVFDVTQDDYILTVHFEDNEGMPGESSGCNDDVYGNQYVSVKTGLDYSGPLTVSYTVDWAASGYACRGVTGMDFSCTGYYGADSIPNDPWCGTMNGNNYVDDVSYTTVDANWSWSDSLEVSYTWDAGSDDVYTLRSYLFLGGQTVDFTFGISNISVNGYSIYDGEDGSEAGGVVTSTCSLVAGVRFADNDGVYAKRVFAHDQPPTGLWFYDLESGGRPVAGAWDLEHGPVTVFTSTDSAGLAMSIDITGTYDTEMQDVAFRVLQSGDWVTDTDSVPPPIDPTVVDGECYVLIPAFDNPLCGGSQFLCSLVGVPDHSFAGLQVCLRLLDPGLNLPIVGDPLERLSPVVGVVIALVLWRVLRGG